jgi:dTDP-4-dehydrorhamnose 3,5-epimerase
MFYALCGNREYFDWGDSLKGKRHRMQFIPTRIEGLLIVEPDVHRDVRGFFMETYHRDKYRDGGVPGPFIQDNHSRSGRGTVRGLHAQRTHPQGKLVRVIEGEIYDVAVDLRQGSPTFAQWVAMNLSADNCRQCYIPPGFAHGFCVVSEWAQVEYKCTDLYHPGDEITIRWNDPDLAIQWPMDSPILSEKDRTAPQFREMAPTLPNEGAYRYHQPRETDGQ